MVATVFSAGLRWRQDKTLILNSTSRCLKREVKKGLRVVLGKMSKHYAFCTKVTRIFNISVLSQVLIIYDCNYIFIIMKIMMFICWFKIVLIKSFHSLHLKIHLSFK